MICVVWLFRYKMNNNNNYLKVRENSDLVRDKDSKAILNINDKALNKYKEEREQRIKTNRMIEEFDSVKNDMNEIKTLLQELLGQKK